MWQGSVAGIYIATEGGGAMQGVGEVLATPGKGLEGDRYAAGAGTYSRRSGSGGVASGAREPPGTTKPDREVTLIESEAVETACAKYGIRLDPGDSRRNIVTRGVPLNHLIDTEFTVGAVTLRGIRLAEPCSHLARLTGQDVIGPLTHSGGLRAQIVKGGTIRVGDRVAPAHDVLPVKRLDPALPLPARQHPDDAGLDLHAAQDVSIKPGERAVVGTGVAVAIPPGLVGLVTPRSGLAARGGLGIVNAPGVVDSGYRGEVKLILVNLDPDEPVDIRRGDRVAQLLLVPALRLEAREASELPPTERGGGGLGSTGL